MCFLLHEVRKRTPVVTSKQTSVSPFTTFSSCLAISNSLLQRTLKKDVPREAKVEFMAGSFWLVQQVQKSAAALQHKIHQRIW
jgi:hypothetical protein